MDFGERTWGVLSGDVSFETVTPILSHVIESEKILSKIQNLKFHNSLNTFSRVCMSIH